MSTTVRSVRALATIVVGDIRGYTSMVQRSDADTVQRSVNNVFDDLHRQVVEHGGTVKEYQGDAVVAFWEGDASAAYVSRACDAALALNARAKAIATDQRIWRVPGFKLEMDWALATGEVTIEPVGGSQPSGLSIVGEAAVLAFRLEKFASDETGNILACRTTHALARSLFDFRELGEMHAEGFEQPDAVYTLVGPREITVDDDDDATLLGKW